MQDIAAYNAAKSGLLVAAAGHRLSARHRRRRRLADRVEPRYVIVAGLVLFALSSLLLAFSGAATTFWLLAFWLVIGRAGLGMLIPALNVGAVQSLSGTELAYASSSVNFVRQLGGAAGVNLLAVVLDWRLGAHGPAMAADAFHECFALVTLAVRGGYHSSLVDSKIGEIAMYRKILVAYDGSPGSQNSPSTNASI